MTIEYLELYEKRKKIQPLAVSGIFQTLRNITIFITLSFYFIMPWLNWHGRQAIWFDLPGRKFYILGITFWPQDFILLSWLLIIAALSLFLATVIAGRVWCGYTCPQTVWTKLFMSIEQLAEGNRSQRIKLDNLPMNVNKFCRRLLKHTLWLLLSLATAIAFVGYFAPIREMVPDMLAFNTNVWSAFWITFFTMATYINAGWMREQVCLHMCPYARFQSVMFDRDTMVITYDYHRGEPRGSRSRAQDPKKVGLGDCINCYQCVHACPTGIDIRDGLQYQCIGCAACIDACNRIMNRIGYQPNLIKYSTERAVEDRKPSPILRGRPIFYLMVIIILATLFAYEVLTRPLLEVDIIRDRNQLYRITNDGLVENVYRIKIINKSQRDETYTIELSDPRRFNYVGKETIAIAAGGIVAVAASIQANPEELEQGNIGLELYVKSQQVQDVFIKRTTFIKEQ